MGFVRDLTANGFNLFWKCVVLSIANFESIESLVWNEQLKSYILVRLIEQYFVHKNYERIFCVGADISCLKRFTGEHIPKNDMFQVNKIHAKIWHVENFPMRNVKLLQSFSPRTRLWL